MVRPRVNFNALFLRGRTIIRSFMIAGGNGKNDPARGAPGRCGRLSGGSGARRHSACVFAGIADAGSFSSTWSISPYWSISAGVSQLFRSQSSEIFVFGCPVAFA